jgi:hypothetical protein
VLPFCTCAGDEEYPEIVDNNEDAKKFINILSAWFYEISDQPEYLYIGLKIEDLRASFFGGCYEVLWTYNDIRYAVHGEIDTIIPFQIGWKCGEYKRGSGRDLSNMPFCDASFDRNSGIIIWKVPKNEIGNPQSGSILSNTYAKSCSEIVTFFKILMIIPGLVDHAGDIEGHAYGKDYVIQY